MEVTHAIDFVFESPEGELVNINVLISNKHELIVSCVDPHFVKAFDGVSKNLLKEEVLGDVFDQEYQDNAFILELGEKLREVIKNAID